MSFYHNLQLQNSNSDLQEIRKLWNKWDPIGAFPDKNDCFDEYDSYLEATLLLLNEDASINEIEDYLLFVTQKFMGFDNDRIKRCKPLEFALELQAWFANREVKIN